MKHFDKQYMRDFLAIFLTILVLWGICTFFEKMGYTPAPVLW